MQVPEGRNYEESRPFHLVFDWRRTGSWCGLAGSTVFLIAWAVAIAKTPGYRFGDQWVSDLGVGDGAAFFNAGVIVAGVLSIPFAASLGAVLRASRLGILGSIVLALAGVALACVGVFTETTGDVHWIVSVSFFSMIVLALVLLVLPFYRSRAMQPWTAQFTAGIVLIGIAFAAIFRVGPLVETIAVLLIAMWSLVIAWKLRWYLCVVHPEETLEASNAKTG